jgi:hypothetical protein
MKAIRLFLTLILLVLLVPFAVLALPAVATLLIISWLNGLEWVIQRLFGDKYGQQLLIIRWLNGLEWEKPTDDKTKPD